MLNRRPDPSSPPADVSLETAGTASSTARRRAIRAVAVIEAFKGAVVVLVATGLLALVHRDLHDLGVRLVEYTRLNPASKYPHIFLDAVSHIDQPHLLWLAAGASGYAAVRFVEAYGLFWQRAWAEWLAALSGGVYMPFEVAGLIRRPSALGAVVFLANVAVVAVMVWALTQRRRSPPGSQT